MPSLQERLGSILRDVLPVEDEPDGGLTVHHDATFASLRVVNIAEGLDLVSLTQIVAWDLPLTKKLSDQVAKQAHDSNFGNVTMVEKVSDKAAQRNSGKGAVQDRGRDAAIQLSRCSPHRRRPAHPDPAGARYGRPDTARADAEPLSRRDQRPQSEQVPKISMVWLTSE